MGQHACSLARAEVQKVRAACIYGLQLMPKQVASGFLQGWRRLLLQAPTSTGWLTLGQQCQHVLLAHCRQAEEHIQLLGAQLTQPLSDGIALPAQRQHRVLPRVTAEWQAALHNSWPATPATVGRSNVLRTCCQRRSLTPA